MGQTPRLFVRLEGDATQGPESSAPGGTLCAGSVCRPLREHVSHLLLYREEIPAHEQVLERIIPDGAVRLVFNLADAPSAGAGPGYAVEAIGATLAPAIIRLSGRVEGLSVTLRPGAIGALLGVPAAEIAGTAVHLDDLWQGEGSRLLEQMAQAPDDSARIQLLERALIA